MKTLIALLFTVNMMANVSPDHISTFYYDPSVSISFENWTEGELNVKITNQEEELIFNDRLDTGKSKGVKYNLRNLKSGKYTISLENDIKKVIETLILFDGKIVEKEEQVYYRPVITETDNKIKVNFLTSSKRAEVKIIGEDGTVYHDVFEKAFPLNKVFDISALRSGKYSILVTDGITSRTLSIKR